MGEVVVSADHGVARSLAVSVSIACVLTSSRVPAFAPARPPVRNFLRGL